MNAVSSSVRQLKDRLCWVRDDEYRTSFHTKTNLCSWALSGAMLRALKIQISKVVVKRVQEPVIHDLHHILAVLLASLFAHLKPWSLEIASLYAEWRFFL